MTRRLPLVAIPLALIAAGIAVARGAAPALPPIMASSLVADLTRAVDDPPPMSGTIEARFSLGIPSGSLPGLRDAIRSIEGLHRIRVWRSPGAFRVAELGDTFEEDEYITAEGGWAWFSRPPGAIRLPAGTLASLAEDERSGLALAQRKSSMSDPIAIARTALAGQIARLVSAGTGRVAGRAVYRLDLFPDASTTLASAVRLAVDSATKIPLRAVVLGRGGAVAIDAVYRSVRFGPVEPRVFAFTPPPYAAIAGEPREGLVRRSFRSSGRGFAAVYSFDIPAFFRGFSSLRKQFPFTTTLMAGRIVEHDGRVRIVFGPVPQDVLAAAP